MKSIDVTVSVLLHILEAARLSSIKLPLITVDNLIAAQNCATGFIGLNMLPEIWNN
jgi:hypothetical protein